MTLNGVMALILRYFAEFDSFRGPSINRLFPEKCHKVGLHQLSTTDRCAVLFALLVLCCSLVSIIVLIVGLVTSTSRCLSAMLKRTPSTSDVALKPGAGLGDYITSERVCFRNSQKQWMFSICFLNSLLIQCPVQYQCLFLRPGTVGTAGGCQGYTQYKLTLKSLAVPVSCNYCSAQFVQQCRNVHVPTQGSLVVIQYFKCNVNMLLSLY